MGRISRTAAKVNKKRPLPQLRRGGGGAPFSLAFTTLKMKNLLSRSSFGTAGSKWVEDLVFR
jgi:hypothetical protein